MASVKKSDWVPKGIRCVRAESESDLQSRHGPGLCTIGSSGGQISDPVRGAGLIRSSWWGAGWRAFFRGRTRVKELRAAQPFCSASFIVHCGTQNPAFCQMNSKLQQVFEESYLIAPYNVWLVLDTQKCKCCREA